MNRTVAYQETANNYDDVRQSIKNAQITTIKNFGVQPPAGAGDFVGQLGVSSDVNGNALLYVSGVGGNWQLVGTSGTANMPDEVVLEDRKNNFTEVDQRVLDCPIAFVESGVRTPSTMPVKGVGHMYVFESNPVEVYISYDGHTWTPIQANTSGDVELDKPNDFTNPDQTIKGNPIARVVQTSLSPSASGLLPTSAGQLYVQIAEGTSDGKTRLWVSSNSGSGWRWESLSQTYELPNTVAMTSKSNDFQAVDQKISGKQILSFIDGGDKNPGESGTSPDYSGQFYIASHTNIQGKIDCAIWVAQGNQWLPIQQDIELGTIARTDKSNRFSQPNQILGEGGPNARWLTGARIKFSGHAPNADQKWRVQNVGEITIYENVTAVPREFSVWIGISINPDPNSNLNEWALVWSSTAGNSADFARVDKSNVFAPMQYISNGSTNSLISVGHEGGSAGPKGSLTPMSPGDTYTQSYNHPSEGETRNIWMATLASDRDSWKRILSKDDHDVILNDQPNYYNNWNQFLGKDGNTKKDRVMGCRINHVGGSPFGVMPNMVGEVIICEEWDPAHPSDEDKKIVNCYIAAAPNREGWMQIGSALKVDLDYQGKDSND